jgi:hypothetical protein
MDVRHRLGEPAAISPADHVVMRDVDPGVAPPADVEELVDRERHAVALVPHV